MTYKNQDQIKIQAYPKQRGYLRDMQTGYAGHIDHIGRAQARRMPAPESQAQSSGSSPESIYRCNEEYGQSTARAT